MSQLLFDFISERRMTPRQRRLNGAKIIFNNNMALIECVVRDLSPKGARLRIARPVGIPDLFDLRMDRSGQTWPCKVAWRSHDQIGVTFLDVR